MILLTILEWPWANIFYSLVSKAVMWWGKMSKIALRCTQHKCKTATWNMKNLNLTFANFTMFSVFFKCVNSIICSLLMSQLKVVEHWITLYLEVLRWFLSLPPSQFMFPAGVHPLPEMIGCAFSEITWEKRDWNRHPSSEKQPEQLYADWQALPFKTFTFKRTPWSLWTLTVL